MKASPRTIFDPFDPVIKLSAETYPVGGGGVGGKLIECRGSLHFRHYIKRGGQYAGHNREDTGKHKRI